MKTSKIILAAIFALGGILTTRAATETFGESIAFFAYVSNADGSKIDNSAPIKIDFRLWATNGTSKTCLWGREVMVALNDDGGFYTDLRDQSGDVLSGAKYTSLVSALSASDLKGGGLCISYAPAGSEADFLEPLASQPIACRAKVAENIRKITLDSGEVKSITLKGAITVSDEIIIEGNFSQEGEINVDGNLYYGEVFIWGDNIYLGGSISGWQYYRGMRDPFYEVPNDMFTVQSIVLNNERTYFTIPFTERSVEFYSIDGDYSEDSSTAVQVHGYSILGSNRY